MKGIIGIIAIVLLITFCTGELRAQVTKVNNSAGDVQINLALDGNDLSISRGNTISLPYGTGDVTSLTGSIGVSGTGTSGIVTLNAGVSSNLWNASKFQGKTVSTAAPTLVGQVLKYNGTDWIPSTDDTGTGGATSWNTTIPDIFFTAGNVAIGTTAQSEITLAVKGTIHAKELIVDLSIPGPDYVFAPDYDLLTLQDVESHINVYKHLPGVPSAKQLEEEHIPLSEMNMVILKKVEELSLYIIDHEKRINNLEKANQNQNQKK